MNGQIYQPYYHIRGWLRLILHQPCWFKMKTKGVLLLFIILALIPGCESSSNKNLPDSLKGTWRTSAPSYENCFFELDNEFVTFINGPMADHVEVYFIDKISQNAGKRGETLYIINAENTDNDKYKFSFYYYPSKGGTIRFIHKRQIAWTKETNS